MEKARWRRLGCNEEAHQGIKAGCGDGSTSRRQQGNFPFVLGGWMDWPPGSLYSNSVSHTHVKQAVNLVLLLVSLGLGLWIISLSNTVLTSVCWCAVELSLVSRGRGMAWKEAPGLCALESSVG